MTKKVICHTSVKSPKKKEMIVIVAQYPATIARKKVICREIAPKKELSNAIIVTRKDIFRANVPKKTKETTEIEAHNRTNKLLQSLKDLFRDSLINCKLNYIFVMNLFQKK